MKYQVQTTEGMKIAEGIESFELGPECIVFRDTNGDVVLMVHDRSFISAEKVADDS